jgi:hypothetical protein
MPNRALLTVVAHRSRARLAVRPGMGTLPERPAGSDAADRHYSAAHGHL